MKPTISISIILTVLATMFNSCDNNSKEEEIPTDKEVVESYVYLLGRALAIRQEQMDFDNTGLEYNTIKYNETGKADFVNPNLDVAYMEAWIAIDENSAVILEIPEITSKYYTAQLMDGWGEVITNIHQRNYPEHAFGKFAICLKNTTANIPEDAFRIEVKNKKIKMLARVELQDNIEEAIELQNKFKISTIGTPKIDPIVDFPMFTNKELPLSKLYTYTEQFLETPDTKMNEADSLRQLADKVSAYIAASETNALSVDSLIKYKAIPKFINYAVTKAGVFKNGWLAPLEAGNYNGNYWTRTSANFVGIWANTAAEVIYYMVGQDSDQEPLEGGESYMLKFDKQNLPNENVNEFWSVILVDFPTYRVVDNELNRYNFNNYSDLMYEEDGSLILYVAPKYNEEWPKSNWLPAPKQGGFNLTLRMYVPKENVLKGEWFPSSLQKL